LNLCSAIALALIALSVEGQEPFRSEVKEVRVPVIVTDSHGRRIYGLKESDFQVFEDGTPERIVSFRAEKSPEASLPGDPVAAASTPTGAADVPLRTYLIIVDTLHTSFANFAQAQKALGKFFKTEPPGDAQYVLVTIRREVRVMQDSTRDPAAILATLRAKSFSKVFLESDASNLANATEQFVALMKTYCNNCACSSSGTTTDSVMCLGVKQKVPLFLTGFSERSLILNLRFLRQLAEVTRATARIPTSRTIIFLSDGFNRFPGRELQGVLMGFGPLDRSFQFATTSRDLQPELDAVLKVATHDDVKFYTIDSRGIQTQASIAGAGFAASTGMDASSGVPMGVLTQLGSAARENTDALALLAHETGGVFFENSNDLVKGIRQAVTDGRESYVLSYVATNKAADGKYRRIVVTMKEQRWKVHAKPGYWAAVN
jgi:VWFA-related protein